MITHVVRESSTGDLYALHVPKTRTSREDDVYRVFAKEVMKMEGTDSPGFDCGNVDIDVFPCPEFGHATRIVFPGDEEA